MTGLAEFSAFEYAVMGRHFEGEKNYNTPPVNFLDREWKLQLGTVNGKIYKIAPFLEFEDRKDADVAMKDALNYCKEQKGKPSEEKKGLMVWDTADGNVVLHPLDTAGFLALVLSSLQNLYETSNENKSGESSALFRH